MKSLHSFLPMLGLFLVASIILAPLSYAQTLTVLHSFNSNGEDGQVPLAGLLLAKGVFYGTTEQGGSRTGSGTVFQVDAKGNETVLYAFTVANGSVPSAGLVRDAAGNLYGTTTEGGQFNLGTIFKLDSSGVETVLHHFSGGADGSIPFAGLILDAAGNLYGASNTGGDLTCNCGTVFEIDASGSESVLYRFTGGTDGSFPVTGNLIRDSAGNLLGTTGSGGAFGQGAVFKIHPDGTETTLYSFTGKSDGGSPFCNLIRDGNGNLYGTTSGGGTFRFGTVFKIDSQGHESVLHNFAGGSDGESPMAGLVLDSKGNLYGTTAAGGVIGKYGYGTIFEISQNGTETVLHAFNRLDGQTPAAGLIRDGKGNLYGTTSSGGVQGRGTVFKLTP
jgi:uncharacterized repeat protein (TIGR03803 family)